MPRNKELYLNVLFSSTTNKKGKMMSMFGTDEC